MTHRQKMCHHQDEKAVSSDQGLVFRREMKVAVLPREEEEETSLKAVAVALLLNRHSKYLERFEQVAVLPREEEETSLKAVAVALFLNRHSKYLGRCEPAPLSRPRFF